MKNKEESTFVLDAMGIEQEKWSIARIAKLVLRIWITIVDFSINALLDIKPMHSMGF